MSRTCIRAGSSLPPSAFDALRLQACLNHAKWDPQVGDVATLARFPLILADTTWRQLCAWAESLAAELLAAEKELITSSGLLRRIGVPWRLRRHMQSAGDLPRVVRFDFHPTADGWRISEANADVPGGFNESAFLASVMCGYLSGAKSSGDPLGVWAETVIAAAGESDGIIALVSAPGFMEDTQVVAGLARCLAERNIPSLMCSPRNLLWDKNGNATLWGRRVSAIVRFVQAEWLPALDPHWRHWWKARLPILNPPTAMIAESKRLPLVWKDLSIPMPTWRQLLPETADPHDAPWRTGEWIVKPAYGNTGDDVASIAWTPKKEWRRISWQLRLNPRSWVAQRRFDAQSIDTPLGLYRPCIGVFTIGGRAVGAYGRLAASHVVDYRAIDAAVLIEARSEHFDAEE